MFGPKLDPDVKAAQKAAKELQKTAERQLLEERRVQQLQERKEREALERAARQARFDAMPEFVVRQYREVTVKASNKADAMEIAKEAFKHGQNADFGVARSDLWHLEGNTIDKIRVVGMKVARFFD